MPTPPFAAVPDLNAAHALHEYDIGWMKAMRPACGIVLCGCAHDDLLIAQRNIFVAPLLYEDVHQGPREESLRD